MEDNIHIPVKYARERDVLSYDIVNMCAIESSE